MSDDKDKDAQGDSDADADDKSGDSTDKSKPGSSGESEQEKQTRLALEEQNRLDQTAGVDYDRYSGHRHDCGPSIAGVQCDRRHLHCHHRRGFGGCYIGHR